MFFYLFIFLPLNFCVLKCLSVLCLCSTCVHIVYEICYIHMNCLYLIRTRHSSISMNIFLIFKNKFKKSHATKQDESGSKIFNLQDMTDIVPSPLLTPIPPQENTNTYRRKLHRLLSFSSIWAFH